MSSWRLSRREKMCDFMQTCATLGTLWGVQRDSHAEWGLMWINVLGEVGQGGTANQRTGSSAGARTRLCWRAAARTARSRSPVVSTCCQSSADTMHNLPALHCKTCAHQGVIVGPLQACSPPSVMATFHLLPVSLPHSATLPKEPPHALLGGSCLRWDGMR